MDDQFFVKKIIRVEFHCHSAHSSDGLGSPRDLIDAARRKGLNRLAITDHNTIRGALEAKEKDPEFIIVGEEIRTDRGELLALYVNEEIPPRLPYLETLNRLKNMGAFICIPHPFDNYRSSWRIEDMNALIPYIDAIEVLNARCLLSSFNNSARVFARLHHLGQIAGSDAHNPIEIGRVVTELPDFSSAEELRKVILLANVYGKESPFWYHLLSVYARIKKQINKEI